MMLTMIISTIALLLPILLEKMINMLERILETLNANSGVIIAMVLRNFGKTISITWEPFAIAFVLSVLIGLFFGVYPARKAAGLDPVQALSQK